MGDFTLHLTKILRAAADRAYDALTLPDVLSVWFTSKAEADLRVGGRYSNADGDRGEFLTLDRPKRLIFTWDNQAHCPGTVVEIELKQTSIADVEVSLRHREIKDQAGLEDMKQGWSWALDSLKSYLETGSPIPHDEWMLARGLEDEA